MLPNAHQREIAAVAPACVRDRVVSVKTHLSFLFLVRQWPPHFKWSLETASINMRMSMCVFLRMQCALPVTAACRCNNTMRRITIQMILHLHGLHVCVCACVREQSIVHYQWQPRVQDQQSPAAHNAAPPPPDLALPRCPYARESLLQIAGLMNKIYLY